MCYVHPEALPRGDRLSNTDPNQSQEDTSETTESTHSLTYKAKQQPIRQIKADETHKAGTKQI